MHKPYQTRKAIRKQGYNYSDPGHYFITVCSYHQKSLFGEIFNGKMQLNKYGEIVHYCWNQLPKHYRRLRLDSFAVMPNHIHGILVLDSPDSSDEKRNGITLPEIVRALKSFSAREINKIRKSSEEPVWQRTYYDHIIRSEKSLGLMRLYIATNPLTWAFDHNNSEISVSREEIRKRFISSGIFKEEDMEIIMNYVEYRQIRSAGRLNVDLKSGRV